MIPPKSLRHLRGVQTLFKHYFGVHTTCKSARPRIGVIGAGAIGLSSALCIQNRIPKCDVTIIADKFSPDTTSDGAAGLWTPLLVSDAQKEKVTKWGDDTFAYLLDITRSDQAAACGVQLISGYNFSPDLATDPPWRDNVIGFRRLSKAELALYPGKRFGVFFTAFTINVPSLLSVFMQRFSDNGGKTIKRKLQSIDEIASSYDVIVNCTGLGAYHLVNDHAVKPVRGQVVRVKAPWIKHFYMDWDDDNNITYILPGSETTVLGGTAQADDWNTENSDEDINGIRSRCQELMPSLKDAEVVRYWAGLRPARDIIRLEIDSERLQGTTQVVHNYGHAGAGLTLFWGCGLNAADLVEQLVVASISKL